MAAALCGATYADNPSTIVSRAEYPQFAMIGRLESQRIITQGGVTGISKGSAFLVSPCYLLTAAHVVLPESFHVSRDIDYTMQFRVGVGSSTPFLGHVDARPDFGLMQTTNGKELLLLKLPPDKCVGGLPNIGWLEPSSLPLSKGRSVAAAGFPGGLPDGTFAVGYGRTGAVTPTGKIGFSGSFMMGQSGGPVLTWEDGTMKVVGVIGYQVGHTLDQSYATYSFTNANGVEDVVAYLDRPVIKAIIAADKATFGKPNPAAGRIRTEHVPPR